MSVYIIVILGGVILLTVLLVLGAVLILAGVRKRKNETPQDVQINDYGDLGEN